MEWSTRAGQWLAQMDELGLAASGAEPPRQDTYLLAMGQMLRRSPVHFDHAGLSARQEERVCSFVRAGAYTDAALALLPANTALMVSGAEPILACASVRLEGQTRETTATGRSFALAVVSALALAVLEHPASFALA